jgi:hypothetical protein
VVDGSRCSSVANHVKESTPAKLAGALRNIRFCAFSLHLDLSLVNCSPHLAAISPEIPGADVQQFHDSCSLTSCPVLRS